jgi:iron complex outermembrane recepter protein
MLTSMTFRSMLAAVACAISFSAHAIADPRQLDVPAGELIPALEALEKQAAIEIVYQPEQLKSLRTKGVKGTYEPKAAVQLLLKGTTLELRTDPTGAMVIAPHTPSTTSTAVAAGAAVAAQEPGPDQKEGKTSSSDPFRVAQADQGAGQASIPVEKAPKSSGTTAEAEGRLEEVIVTAQKRAENLQDVPVSVQVISSQEFQQENHNTLAELTRTIPAVHVTDGLDSNNLFIRGVGSGGNPAFDQSVAVFVDDVYRGRSRTIEMSFLDVDRLEVLKGPQSTFFGNNAIAGALSIITKKPGDHFDAWARALYGMNDEYAFEGAIGGPLTDTIGVRVAGTYNGTHGWVENVNTGEVGPTQENYAGRITLSFNPSESLDADLKVEAGEHHLTHSGLGSPRLWHNCPPAPPYPPSYASGAVSCQDALNAGIPIGLDTNKVSELPGQGNSLSTFESLLTLNYHMGGYTLTSVSDYNNYHFDSRVDPYALGTYVQTNTDPEKYHQTSQEFRLSSPVGGRFDYLVGIYYQNDEIGFDLIPNAPWLNFLGPLLDPAIPPEDLPLSIKTGFGQKEHLYSIFGSMSWNVTDKLKFKAGLRGTSVKKEFDGSTHYGTGTQLYGGFVQLPPDLEASWGGILGPPGSLHEDLKDEALMPSAGIEYRLNPKAMAYATYNRGFKAGGFNGLTPFVPNGSVAFGPEYVNAYELGLKSEWFDQRLLLNVDVFLSDYKDLQVNTVVYSQVANSYLPTTANAASSRSQGVELEAQWAVSQAFRLAANVTYLDAHFVSFPFATPPTLQTFCSTSYVMPQCSIYPNPPSQFADLSGQRLPFSPLWSGSLTARYTLALPGENRLTTEVSPYWTADYFAGAGNDPVYLVDGYVRLDARLSFEHSSGRWALDVIGKNLTDRIIVTSPSFYLSGIEPRRTVAGQIRIKW